jgi:hypothetical protein
LLKVEVAEVVMVADAAAVVVRRLALVLTVVWGTLRVVPVVVPTMV